MGKIRVKTLGTEETEQEQKKRDEQRRAVKRAKKEGIAPEEILEEKESDKKEKQEKAPKTEAPTKEKQVDGVKVPPNRRPHVRSKRYTGLTAQIDRNKSYSLSEAIELVKKTATTKFDGTVEAHFNLTRLPKDLGLKKDKNLPISYERKFPLAHAKVGKVSDAEKDLKAQIEAITKKIRTPNIKKFTLSSSMGPGVKVTLE